MNGPLYQARPLAGDPEIVDLGAIFGVLWRAKVPLALAALLSGAAAYALASRITPSWEATAQVMLDPRQRVAIDNAGLVPELTLSDSMMASEVAVMRSNLLLERVAAELDLAAAPEFNPALAAPSPVDTARSWIRDRLGLAAAPAEVAPEGSVESSAQDAGADATRAAVLGALQRRLDIEQDGASYVISVEATAKDPALAASIANATANAFIDQGLEQRVAATDRATGWLDQRVADLRGQVEAAEAAIARFKSGNLVLEGSSQEAASRQLLDLATQVSDARARHAAASARYEQARAASETGDGEALASLATSPLIVALRGQRAEQQRAAGQLADVYGSNDARVARARADLADLDGQIAAETASYVAGLKNAAEIAAVELSNLEASLLAMEARLLELSNSSIELRQLEREADAVRDVYESLLARLKETRAIEETSIPDARLIARADVPTEPASPNVKLLAALGAIGGLGAATGFAFLRDMRRRVYRSSGELEAATGLPVLAELPRLRGRKDERLPALLAAPHSRFAERMRDLRSALSLRPGRDARKVVMLTSAQPGEGKSTVAAALAQVASLAGRRTILVDGDLRRPSLAAIAPPAPQSDLASVLLAGTEWRDAVVRRAPCGFDVLPNAGPNAKAADALALPAFARLIEALKAEYDLVVIDTPPVLAVSDARTIAAFADSVLLVVRADRTPVEAVGQALASLGHGRRDLYDAPRARVAGFVMTMQRSGDRRRLEGDYS